MSESQTAGDSSSRKLRVVKPPGALRVVLWEHLIPLLQTLLRLAGWQLQLDGAESVREGVNGGVIFKINRAAAFVPQTHNWTPTKVDSTHLTISTSTWAGGIPTIGGVSLSHSPKPQLTVSASAMVYVYLKVTFSLNITGGYVFTSGSTVTAREISAETGLQTNTNTVQWYLLFQWQAGAVVDQVQFWNMNVLVGDDGSATSAAFYQPYF